MRRSQRAGNSQSTRRDGMTIFSDNWRCFLFLVFALFLNLWKISIKAELMYDIVSLIAKRRRIHFEVLIMS